MNKTVIKFVYDIKQYISVRFFNSSTKNPGHFVDQWSPIHHLLHKTPANRTTEPIELAAEHTQTIDERERSP